MIRVATLNDISELKDLMIKLLNHHQEFNVLYQIDFTHQNDIERFFSDIIFEQNVHVYVEEIENELAGFIICSRQIRPNYFEIKSKGRIDSLYIASKFRNQNLASNLLKKALEYLKDETYIELEFTAKNQLANDFWINKGFEILNHQCILRQK